MKTSRKGTWYEIIIPESWSGYTLDKLLREMWMVPKKTLHMFRMEKKVLINGAPPNWNQLLKPHDKIQLELFQPEDFGVIPSYREIDILFEDDHLLILNKPAGIDTHPNSPEETDTLQNAAAYYLQARGIQQKPRHVHRLDRDTSGTVVFAKTALAGAILDKLLEKRKIKRTYLAITDGLIQKKKGTINEPIGRDRHHPVRRRVSKSGQNAITHYQVVTVDKKRRQTWVKCALDTGRTHQIRVHFSSLGHPLSGDVLYGGSSVYPRQALHAVKIELPHPFTGETICCHAPFLDVPSIFTGFDPFSI